MTGTREGEARPALAVGQMTTSELRRRRRELEHALQGKVIGNAPIATDLGRDLEAVAAEEAARERLAEASRSKATESRLGTEAWLKGKPLRSGQAER